MTYSMTIICEKHFYKEIHLLTIFAIFRALKSAQNNNFQVVRTISLVSSLKSVHKTFHVVLTHKQKTPTL